MNQKTIERFFQWLGDRLEIPTTIILTGACAGAFWGRIRPTLDIDFAVMPRAGTRWKQEDWQRLETVIQGCAREMGVAVNFAEDIDRWSQITFLDYREHTRLLRRFRRVEVRVIEPAYWAIGKLARYLDLDVSDLSSVLKSQRVSWISAVRLWGRALRESPRSVALKQFQKQTEHFLAASGQKIWGRDFDSESAIQSFRREAGIPLTPRSG